jgi:hypothetical protein
MTHQRPSGVWFEEDNKPLPEPGFFRKIFSDWWEGLFTLVVWTLGLVLGSIPSILISVVSAPVGIMSAAFTLGPGLAGLMVACATGARGGFIRLGDAWRGLRRVYWRSVLLALPLTLVLALILITRDVVAAASGRTELVISWAFQTGVALTLAILHIYLYPVLALYDFPVKRTVLVSAVLASKYVLQTIALLVVAAALFAATSFHPLIWLFVLGAWCVIATNATWRMARALLPDSDGIDK